MYEARWWSHSLAAMIAVIVTPLAWRLAEARTYHVATGGNDNHPGSRAQPLRSIQKAADLARAGDVILLRGGVYREPVVLRYSGRQGAPIVLKNYPKERSVIDPGERAQRPPGHGILLQARFADAKNWLIANNTIALNKNRAGIVLWQDGLENCVVQNNIFYKNGGVNGVLFYSQQGQRHAIRNNIFYPPGEDLVSTEENAFQATDNLQVDPLFANPDSHDFRLTAQSPAIDAGTSERVPPTDLQGRRRPQGDRPDIGAYEFVANRRLGRVGGYENGSR